MYFPSFIGEVPRLTGRRGPASQIMPPPSPYDGDTSSAPLEGKVVDQLAPAITIHITPKRSVTMPKREAKKVLVRGCRT